MRHITNDVFLGEFVRGMHKWGAGVMVLCLFLHMGTNFFIGAYKYPREINWVIGVVLLVLTLTMAFTGILLPLDQRAYWATTIGLNINASGPLVGPYLADFLRGGAEFGAATLSRFYSLHILLLPALVIALVGRPPVPRSATRHHRPCVGQIRLPSASSRPSPLSTDLALRPTRTRASAVGALGVMAGDMGSHGPVGKRPHRLRGMGSRSNRSYDDWAA